MASSIVVRAYAERYDAGEIHEFLNQALDAYAKNLPRVEVTSANMKESGTAGQFIEGKPLELIETFQAALDYQKSHAGNPEKVANPLMNHLNFSCRRVGW